MPSYSEAKQDQRHDMKRRNRLDDPPIFSATASLSTFLDLQGRKVKKPCTTPAAERKVGKDFIGLAREISETEPAENIIHQDSPEKALEDVSLPLPEQQDLSTRYTIFVNADLLRSQSSLMSFLEKKDSDNLAIIYRDFDNTFEAVPHVILSPVSCALITNYQTLIQRPLPGQAASSGTSSTLHHNIQRLCVSFERISILVACNIGSTSSNSTFTSNSTCQTMAQFTGFCTGFSMQSSNLSVRPIWIQYTTQKFLTESLNDHIWSLITREAQQRPQTTETHDKPLNLAIHHISSTYSLIQDETQWEIFLRRAGLNCMSAQIVLSILSKPPQRPAPMGATTTPETTTIPSTRPSESPVINRIHHETDLCGLPLLVSMTPTDRLELFGHLLGLRIINRLNRILDG